MKVKFKTLKGEQFEVDAEPTDTVLSLKEAVVAVKESLAPAECMKLILAGRILENDKKILDYTIEETNFLVVMAGKPKPAPAPAPEPAPAVPSSDLDATPGSAPPVVQTATAEPPLQPAPARPAPEPVVVNEERVADLCAMGFRRDDVVTCLQAAFNNPDLAVEYLTTGLPDDEEDDDADEEELEALEEMARGMPFPGMGGSEGDRGEISEEAAAALEELQNHPQFEEIAALIRQDPSMLQQVLPALAQQNPELMQLISTHREEVAELLAGDAPPRDEGFQLTSEETAAVERLQQLGFSRAVVVQAYIICGKSEELAANYLFEQGDDFGDD